jgi:hypothetical protein
MLTQISAIALGSGNQEAAEKIANTIGKNFPDADIDVSYQGGQVWLKGEAGSQDQRKKIIEQVRSLPGINVTEVKDEIQIVAPKTPVRPSPVQAVQAARPAASPGTAPVPIPNTSAAPRTGTPAPIVATNARQTSHQAQTQAVQPPQPPTMATAGMAPYPHQHYAPAYGVRPGQRSAVPMPYAPAPQAIPIQQHSQQHASHPQHHPPVYYGPPAGMAHHPEAYGPQGPMPGRYNQPNLPDYAWPTYANYPNYAQVTYPRSYSPKAWPYIGPFYPYPQVPLGWRKVTLEHHNGWWWLDFDDGAPSGAFNGLFRHSQQYTY